MARRSAYFPAPRCQWWETQYQPRGQIVLEESPPDIMDTGLLDADGQPILKRWVNTPIGFYPLRERDE